MSNELLTDYSTQQAVNKLVEDGIGSGSSSGGASGAILLGVGSGGYTFDASAQTITITGMGTLSLSQIFSVVNLTDQITLYSPTDEDKGGTLSSNVLTLEYDTTSMSDSDLLQIFVQSNGSYDASTQSDKVSTLNTEYSHYTDAEPLVTASDIVATTTVYKDQGAEIDMTGYTTLGMFVKFTVNDSETNTIKVLRKHTSAGAEEFVLETEADYIKTLGDASINIYYEFETNGTIPVVQVQSTATTVGGTEGTLEIYIVKK